MKKLIATAVASVAMALCAAPASAAVVSCDSSGPIDLVAFGCTSSGIGASGNDHLADVEAALADALNVPVSSLNLTPYLRKSDDDDADDFFIFSPNANPETGMSTDWLIKDGTKVKYVTVKAGTGFKLYEIAGAGASSGINFNTDGLLNKGGQQPDISHLSFWTVPGTTGAVPEPATWAMMILGFGMVGAATRRRRARNVSAYA